MSAGDSEWYGDPHILTADEVRPPGGLFDNGDLGSYRLQHPPSCGQEERDYGAGIKCPVWTCDIARHEQATGLAASLRYTGTPITEPGTYRIQAWATKTMTELGVEYDSGISVMPPEDAT